MSVMSSSKMVYVYVASHIFLALFITILVSPKPTGCPVSTGCNKISNTHSIRPQCL